MTTHLDIEKERRKQFEEAYFAKWLESYEEYEGARDALFRRWTNQPDDYMVHETREAWIGWQMALAARSASLPPMRGTDSQQDAGAPDFCPECHLQASMPDREEMAIVGRKLANWLFGLSVAQAMPDVWRKTCAELVAAWNVVAGEPAPAGSAKGGNTQPETAARTSLQDAEYHRTVQLLTDPPYGKPDLYARLHVSLTKELGMAAEQGKTAEWATAAHSLIDFLMDERGEAVASLQADEGKGAARYRWLRDGNAYFPEEWGIRGGAELDDAIDSAIAANEGNPAV